MQRIDNDMFPPFCLIFFSTVKTQRKCVVGIICGFIRQLLFETLAAPINIQWITPEVHTKIYKSLHVKFCYCHLILTTIGAGEQMSLKITETNLN
jgi:hypothetical protein